MGDCLFYSDEVVCICIVAILLMTVAGGGDEGRWENQEMAEETPALRWAGASSEGTGPTPGNVVARDVHL